MLPSRRALQLFSTIVLSGFVEFKRLADIRNPGSQGSGILPEVRSWMHGDSDRSQRHPALSRTARAAI